MSETAYCQKNRDVILNRVKNYYKNNKEEETDIIISLKKRNKE